MQSTMLRTGELAKVLGVSRQHVVHLCDAGKLQHIKIGSHRRIPRQAIESLLSKPLSEAKSPIVVAARRGARRTRRGS